MFTIDEISIKYQRSNLIMKIFNSMYRYKRVKNPFLLHHDDFLYEDLNAKNIKKSILL